MPLVLLTLDLINSALIKISNNGCKSKRIVSLGYPDILASKENLELLFGEELIGKLSLRADAKTILDRHDAHDVNTTVIDAKDLFHELGYELDVIDIVQERNCEILIDLNYPIPKSMHNSYALVLDAGTMEHCFNISQAAQNIGNMAAVGGYVMHGNPINMYNHGFYNLNPTWYYDFYETNGFKIDFMKLVSNPIRGSKICDVHSYLPFENVPEDTSILVLARKLNVSDFDFPIQKKYRR